MTQNTPNPPPHDRPDGAGRWVGIVASVFAVVLIPVLLIWTTNVPVDTGPRVATVNPTTYAQLTVIAEDRAAREIRVATRAARTLSAGTPTANTRDAAEVDEENADKPNQRRGKRTPTPTP